MAHMTMLQAIRELDDRQHGPGRAHRIRRGAPAYTRIEDGIFS